MLNSEGTVHKTHIIVNPVRLEKLSKLVYF